MLTLREIAERMEARYDGDGSIELIGPAEPKKADSNQLALALNEKYADALKSGNAIAALITEEINWKNIPLKGVIFAPNPRYALSKISKVFHEDMLLDACIHSSAIIDGNLLESDISIGPFSIVEKGASIGAGSRIGANCFIGENVKIGKKARIQNGVTIGKNIQIGDNFISQSNSVIGSDGFSYVSPGEKDILDARKAGSTRDLHAIKGYEKIESLGSISIEDNVEIGACVTIDRGTIDKTVIKEGTKIDNLVHIAHNVKLGKNCLICGQVGIAGSTIIGDRVVMAGQVGVGDNLSIGSDVIIAGKSGVSSNVPANRFMMGNPAMQMDKNIAAYKIFRRLPQLEKKIKAFLNKK